MAGQRRGASPLAMGMLLPRYVIAQSKTQNVTDASNQLPVDQTVPITRPNNDHAAGYPAGVGVALQHDARPPPPAPAAGAGPPPRPAPPPPPRVPLEDLGRPDPPSTVRWPRSGFLHAADGVGQRVDHVAGPDRRPPAGERARPACCVTGRN